MSWRSGLRAGAAALGVLAALGVIGVATGTVSSVEARGGAQSATARVSARAGGGGGASLRAAGASASAGGGSGRVIDDYLGHR